jgi:F-type H+-transporting ATPase subunit b
MDFTFDARLLVWTLITFGGLVFLLARFAFKPLQRVLGERERSIREALEQARRAGEDTEKVRQENAARLQEARQAAQRIIDESHRVAEEARHEAREESRREADIMVAQARADIERELRRSLDQLKGTVADLSLRISREFIRENLDERRHQELVDEFLQRLKADHAGPGR